MNRTGDDVLPFMKKKKNATAAIANLIMFDDTRRQCCPVAVSCRFLLTTKSADLMRNQKLFRVLFAVLSEDFFRPIVHSSGMVVEQAGDAADSFCDSAKS